MVISLSGTRRLWLCAFSAVLLGAYFFLAGTEFLASFFAARPDPIHLNRAIRLSPGNADFHNRLGRYFAFGISDAQSGLTQLRSAAELNPHRARYWFDLATAYQLVGDAAGQQSALEHAVAAEPTAPNVAWEAANFFLVQGDIDRALREFRVVIENDPYLPSAALATCWRVRPDIDLLLHQVVPARPDSLLTFLSLLTSKHETEGSLKVWARLLQLHQKFETRNLLDYVRYLILARRPDAAFAAWEQAAAFLGLSGYLPGPDNLIVNGDFSLDVLNGGFDWTYQTQPGVQLLLDPTTFREGHRSLSITFEGPGIYDTGIHQFVAVHGATAYEFNVYYKSADFQGAGGPQIVLRDAYTGDALFTGSPMLDGDFWKEIHAEFTTPPATNLLILNIERSPAGSPIRGKLWLDDFQLFPAQTADQSRDHS